MSDKQSASVAKPPEQSTAWERERDKLRAFWIVSVLVFWFMVIFQVVMYFWVDQGKASFVLLSIIAGMMVVGVATKTKYQRHLNKK